MRFAAGESVTVIRAPVVADRYGNEVRDWAAASETTISGCAVLPRHAGENRDQGREGVIVVYLVHAPAGVDVLPSDRVRLRGELFEVEGEAALHRNPFTGWEAGVEFAVRRVEG